MPTAPFGFLLLLGCGVQAADAPPRREYCELLGQATLLSGKVKVTVDFGQSTSRITDEAGKVEKFNSMVDAMNYMAAQGWEFEAAYAVTESSQNVYHWLMSRQSTAGQ